MENGNRIFSNNSNVKDMAFKGYALKSGLAITGGGVGSMLVNISAGYFWRNGILISYAGGSVAVSTAHPTYPRKDIVYIDSAGVAQIITGTPGIATPIGSTGPNTITPIPPNIPTTDTVRCEVWVGAGVTGIYNADLTDIGVFSQTAYGEKDWGLSFKGTVTGIAGAPNFQSTELAGYGDDFWKGYDVYVVWDSDGAGAAPQGEKLPCTASTDAGDITVAAWTTPLAVGDIVLMMHPSLYRGGGDATEAKEDIIIAALGAEDDTPTAADLADIATTSAHAKLSRILMFCYDMITNGSYGLAAIMSALGTAGTWLYNAAHTIPAVVNKIGDVPASLALLYDGLGGQLQHSGPFSYDETSAAEQDLIEWTGAGYDWQQVHGFWLDMVNVTQNTTIRLYYRIDGTNHRLFRTIPWVTTDADGVFIEPFWIETGNNAKLSMQCGGGGAGSVNVPFSTH